MATPKALDGLEKTKEALVGIKARLKPVVQRLKSGGFDETTSQAQATVALSIGMMRYMGARLRGLDQGRKPDDPLRKELDNMRKVLAAIKKKSVVKKASDVKVSEKEPFKNDYTKERAMKTISGSTDQYPPTQIKKIERGKQDDSNEKKRKSSASKRNSKRQRSS